MMVNEFFRFLLQAKSREELANFCQSGNEMAIFNCLDKHEG